MLDHIDPVFQQAVFPFEEDFDHRPWVKIMETHWKDSIYFSIVYVIVIFGLQWYMKDRPKWDLRRPLVLWSLVLAIFSNVCAFRLWQEIFLYKNMYGWRATMCEAVPGYSGVNGFWSLLFVFSKLPELGDTLFIVLRKQKLIFLHWYHHVTVMIYSWYSYPLLVAPGRYFILVNCSVHAIMYTYYALKASRMVRIPRFINVCITFVQMSQMIVGCIVNYLAYHYRSNGEPCSTTDHNLLVALLMYSSYFFLFAHYFYQAYFVRKPSPKPAGGKESNGVNQRSNGVHTNGVAYSNGVKTSRANNVKVD